MNRLPRLPVTAAAAVVAVVALVAPAPVHAAGDTDALDAAAATFLADPYNDGATALYVAVYSKGDGLTVKAYGEAAPGVPATIADHFQFGSITKSMFATAVLQQVEKGVVSLDDTVGALDPALAREYPTLKGITIRDLLSMSTRIPDYADAAVGELFANPATRFSRADLIAMGFEDGKPIPKGGGYSTTNFIILGDVMRAVTGRTPVSMVNDVLRQARMKQSKLTVSGFRPHPSTAGYIGDTYGAQAAQVNPALSATTDTRTWPTTWGREGGGSYGTIGDLYRWAALCVGDGLLDKSMVKERHRTHMINAGEYGLGTIQSIGYWGHEGQTVGYEASAQCDPKTGDVVAVAVNASSALSAAVNDLGPTVFPDYYADYQQALKNTFAAM